QFLLVRTESFLSLYQIMGESVMDEFEQFDDLISFIGNPVYKSVNNFERRRQIVDIFRLSNNYLAQEIVRRWDAKYYEYI
ncbi:MAG: hypothetical protein AAF126_22590, partial [Chloroflexota bacterium]